jgi:hypothetical protein
MPSPILSGRRCFALLAAVSLLLLLFVALLLNRPQPDEGRANAAAALSATKPAAGLREPFRFKRITRTAGSEADAVSAAATVRQKLVRFTLGRLELARALAASNHMTLPPKVEAFFAAVEAGDWEGQGRLLDELKKSPPDDPEQADGWHLVMQAVKETSGVAEAVHTWPPERLLQYGEAVLGALKPGMVYVGGTDGGRFIPTLMNDTSDGERHVVLTQNALADGSYLAYARFRYGEQMALLEPAESQQCFQDYLKDVQARALHDQQFPAESAQLRLGEKVQVVQEDFGSTRVSVSGQTAVMAINEKLLTTLMDKNPGLSFALEESFSLPSTYAGALPSGPLLELRAANPDNPLTPARAVESLDYWRTVQQDLAVEPPDSEMRKQYAKMAVAQANLFAREGFAAEAEQGYRLARELAPALPEAIHGLAGMLQASGRATEASQVLSALPAGK